jgi:phage anti-repressor protein
MSSPDTLDFISLINENPLNKLTNIHGSKIIDKIKEIFTTPEQQMFVAKFYCYLNYDSKKDFVIDLDNIWKWLGFDKKGNCKTLLISDKFIENIDYKYILEDASDPAKASLKKHGGQNKERILMTIYCFKKLCIINNTTKSKEMREYYLNLEEIIHELVSEQSIDLVNQLSIKDKEQQSNFIDMFKKKNVIYFVEVKLRHPIIIGVTNNIRPYKIIKFGLSNNLPQRMASHTTIFGKDIILLWVIETNFNIRLEQLIKIHLASHIVNIDTHTELIELNDDFTFENLKTEVHILKDSMDTTSVPKLLDEINKLKIEIVQLQTNTYIDELLPKLQVENDTLREKIKQLESSANNGILEIERGKLATRNREIELKYASYKRAKNNQASQHVTIDGIIHKLCMGMTCCEQDIKGTWKTLNNFGNDANAKDKLRLICKECRSVEEAASHERTKGPNMTPDELKASKDAKSLKTRTPVIDGKRSCSECKVSKVVEDFKKDGKYINGDTKYRSLCKTCDANHKKELRRVKNEGIYDTIVANNEQLDMYSEEESEEELIMDTNDKEEEEEEE